MRRPEQAAHKAIVHYLRSVLPATWLVVHAPNGGKRSKAEAGVFKALGVLAGFPDILVLGEERKGCQAWFLEVKSPAGTLSAPQKWCHERLRDLGFPVAVVHSIEEAEQALRFWGIQLRGGVA